MWPDVLGPGDARAFNASQIVSDGAKRVWMEQYLLDKRGLGCWLDHQQLGARLGLTARSVETHRLRLEDAGLMARLKEPGQRAHGWRSTIPDHCRMRSQRPSPAEVEKHRSFIDRHVGPLCDGGTWPPRPAKHDDETLSSAGQDPQKRSSKAAPVRVSDALSIAFDSQAFPKVSSAFDVEGKRDRERSLESTSNAVERPRAEVEADGLARIQAAKLKSKSDSPKPGQVRAEFLAVCKLQKGETLTLEERGLVESYLARQSPQRRKAMGL